MLNLRTCVAVLLMSGVTGACSGGSGSPCPRGQDLREERYDDTTSIKSRGCVGLDNERNYRRQGHWEFFHPNGQKSMEATYRDGESEGLVTQWHENGQKSSELTYLNGTETSRTEWDANGNLTTR